MELVLIGVVAGVLYGTFGAGASAFATPLLALAGVPALAAIASPLPATVPAALAGAWTYRRAGVASSPLVRRSIVVGLPAALLGALASAAVPATALLALSGLVLVAVGLRFVGPAAGSPVAAHDPRLVVAAAGAVGFAAGLLANSGGFLLVPVFVLLAGLGMRQAATSSLLVAAALTVPTLATHWALGHVDWWVALTFAVGLVPGTWAGAGLAQRVDADRLQRAFGVLLLTFATWFLVHLAT